MICGIAGALEAQSDANRGCQPKRGWAQLVLFTASLERPGLSMSKAAAQSTQLQDETPIELQEMAAAINALPARYRDAVSPALHRVIECSTRRRRILNLVQEALSQLRLDMKYLIFDLEATRRERDEYKEMLERDDRS